MKGKKEADGENDIMLYQVTVKERPRNVQLEQTNSE